MKAVLSNLGIPTMPLMDRMNAPYQKGDNTFESVMREVSGINWFGCHGSNSGAVTPTFRRR